MEHVLQICGLITSVAAVIAIFTKLFNSIGAIREGQKCLLRAEMLKVYYKHIDDKLLRQHDKEHFIYCYKAYKALKGNSFIDDIYEEVREWEITQ